MRPLPAAVVGTLVLGLAFAGPAQAQTVETPVPASTSTATAEPTVTSQPTVTAGPTAEPTVTSQPTATVNPTTDPGEGDDPDFPGDEGDITISEIKVTPGHGPAGTKIKLSDPLDACLTEDGKPGLVEVALLNDNFLDDADESDFVPDDYATFKADADGDWSGTLKVPADAEDDSQYFVWAACYAPDAVVTIDDSSEDPFVYYDAKLFVVTEAPVAAPATPVAGQPSFTG